MVSKTMANKSIAVIALFAVLAPLAFADRKADLQRQAQAAAAARKLDERAEAMCELARLDKSKQSDCDIAQQEAAAENRRNDDRFNRGVAYYNSGVMDDAEHEFKNIRFGPHYQEAQRYLTVLIPAKKTAQAQPQQPATPAAPASDQTFNDAVQAYNANNFPTAKALFQQVKGAKAGEAQTYIGRMNQYESAMSEGDRLAANGNHRGAQQSYEDAARLKGDGPGDPRNRASREQAAANQPAQPVATPTPTQAVVTPRQTEPTPTAPVVSRQAAIKQPERPKMDIDKLLREAADARGKKNNSAAKSKYVAVLAEQPDNATARNALDQIQQEEQAKPQAETQQVQATPEADIMLARAVGEFYQGHYTEAETHIKDYQNVNGSKKALGYFFSGVSKLTRYYLGGGSDKKLLNDAEAALRIAKSTPGFKAPGEEYVSPKILKVYSGL
jgi:hypothetical protein